MIDGDAAADEEDAGGGQEPEHEPLATVAVVKAVVGLALAALETDEQQQLVPVSAALWIASDSIAPEPDSRNATTLIAVTNMLPASAMTTALTELVAAIVSGAYFQSVADARDLRAFTDDQSPLPGLVVGWRGAGGGRDSSSDRTRQPYRTCRRSRSRPAGMEGSLAFLPHVRQKCRRSPANLDLNARSPSACRVRVHAHAHRREHAHRCRNAFGVVNSRACSPRF